MIHLAKRAPKKQQAEATNSSKSKPEEFTNLYKAALLAILAYAFVYSIIYVVGPSFFGDDTVYLSLAHSVVQGNFQESPFIFSVRLLQIYPIAFFYYVFGVSLLSSAAWDILSYVLTIAVVFFIARELYDNYAGIASALLFAVFPLIVPLSATVSDDIPMAFITSLAMLAILYATRKNSKKWYFATGALIIASVLVTPEGGVIAFPIAAYLLIELARKKIKLDKVSAHFIYGLLVAGILLMIFNTASSANPLITLTTTSHFYSAVGGQNTIPSTNTDPMFYIQQMFPYNILHIVYSSFSSGNFNPVSIFNSIYIINYNSAGFYFYIMVLCAAYLLIRKEKRSYFAIFWLLVAFGYLEFGPMHVSLFPFSYLLSYRLLRFLTVIAAPTVIIIGIAISRLSRIKKRYIGIIIGAAAILFLIATSLPVNSLWYRVSYVERFDQLSIANYLSALPNNTTIYYASSFSDLPIYMKFSNMSRFQVYDSISDCRSIPGNSYIILPKYQEMFGLNYTPNPSKECPYWQQVLYPNATGFPDYITSVAVPFRAQLYYIPAFPENYGFNYSNLTGVGTLEHGNITNFTTINRVDSVNVLLGTTTYPNTTVNVTVTYSGEFKWSDGALTIKYLKSPIINVHYFGVGLANQSNISVQNGQGFSNIISSVGQPIQGPLQNPNTTLNVSWEFAVSNSMAGKTLRICGGYFAAYQNDIRGWPSVFYNLSSKRISIANVSEINVVSSECSYLKVI